MSKIRASILKYLLAFSAFLTALQVKAVNAQIVYMPAPGPWNNGPWNDGSTPAPTDNTTLVIGIVILIFAIIGLVVAIKWIVGLIIKLLSRKGK